MSPSFLPNNELSIEVFPLPAKDRWVTRMVASGTQKHVYDGFYILVDLSKFASMRYFLPYAGTAFVLVLTSALGFGIRGSLLRPAGIDRGPFFTVILLGSVILFTEAINNLPHGAERTAPPLIVAVRLSIRAVFVSFLAFFVIMKMIGYLTEANIPKVNIVKVWSSSLCCLNFDIPLGAKLGQIIYFNFSAQQFFFRWDSIS